MSDLDALVESLSNLTLMEASQLAKMLREKWNISEPVHPLMQSPNKIVMEIERAVEQEYFAVVLESIGPKKIDVIKVVRQLTKLGLAESKALAETQRARILDGVDKVTAESARDLFIQAGATVVLE